LLIAEGGVGVLSSYGSLVVMFLSKTLVRDILMLKSRLVGMGWYGS